MRVISPAPRDVWRAVVGADPNALAFHTPEWTDCLCEFGPFEDSSRLYELDGGRQVVLPMVRRRDRPVSLVTEASLPPTWSPCGVVAPGGTRMEDIAAVLADVRRRRVLRVALRPGPLDADAWGRAQPADAFVLPRLAHVLDLEGGFESVWEQRFSGTARTAVRKAERMRLTVERDTCGRLVPVMYQLFERSLERWARQQHEWLRLARWRRRRLDPIAKLEAIAATLGEACHIWVAWCQRRPAAAIMVLHGRNASYVRGMMDKELAGPTRANYLLHRLAIEEACAAGCRYYDMGETGVSASLAQFKTRFGARPYAYAEYHLERLPITRVSHGARGAVKRVIGFRD
jgi:Acetyltransferase (GNAT) domain